MALTLCSCDKDGKKNETAPESTVDSTEGSTDAPVTGDPNTDEPIVTDVPTVTNDPTATDEPETGANEGVTDSPSTDEPETNAPETAAPETEAPETAAPETVAPETNAPETVPPESEAPQMELTDGVWKNQRVVDGSLINIQLYFGGYNGWDEPHWTSSYGVDINTLNETFRDELLAHKDEMNLPEVDGVLYYIGMGDGFNMTFTVDGNTVTAVFEGDNKAILVLERISGNQLKTVSFDDPFNLFSLLKLSEGVIFTCEELPEVP